MPAKPKTNEIYSIDDTPHGEEREDKALSEANEHPATLQIPNKISVRNKIKPSLKSPPPSFLGKGSQTLMDKQARQHKMPISSDAIRAGWIRRYSRRRNARHQRCNLVNIYQ